METPHAVYRQVMAETGDKIAAIRIIRQRFGLELWQAKEVIQQAEGTAASLDEHQERLADILERALREQGKLPDEADREDSQKDRT